TLSSRFPSAFSSTLHSLSSLLSLSILFPHPPLSTLFPYTTLFRSIQSWGLSSFLMWRLTWQDHLSIPRQLYSLYLWLLLQLLKWQKLQLFRLQVETGVQVSFS